jgi:vacuolar-type H+-ATPase subunit I/STV1
MEIDVKQEMKEIEEEYTRVTEVINSKIEEINELKKRREQIVGAFNYLKNKSDSDKLLEIAKKENEEKIEKD